MIDEAKREVREDGNIGSKERKSLQKSIDMIESYLETGFSAKGAHGMAIFSCEQEGLFEVINLARPVDNAVHIGERPFIEPLSAYPSDDGYSVLLVNRKSARIFTGVSGRLEEIVTITDDVHRWHDQGGWSQARYQRGIEKETKDHLKHAANLIFQQNKAGSIKRLIVGATDELYSELMRKLHPYLQERIAGRIELDIENTSATDVNVSCERVIAEYQRIKEQELLAKLRAEASTGGRGVTGLKDTLVALNEQRVESLLVQTGYHVGGSVCTRCGFIASGNSNCPVDGSELQLTEDIVEMAVESALRQSADVVFLHHHRDLEPLGSIAAVLRY